MRKLTQEYINDKLSCLERVSLLKDQGRQIIGLISCSSKKGSKPAPACEVYQGPIFKSCRSLILSITDSYYIISAKYGVLSPTDIIEPYDLALAKATKQQVKCFDDLVLTQIGYKTFDKKAVFVSLLAKSYATGIKAAIKSKGPFEFFELTNECSQGNKMKMLNILRNKIRKEAGYNFGFGFC